MTAPVTKLFVDSEHTIIFSFEHLFTILQSGFGEDDGRDVLITDGEGIESDIELKIQAMGDKALYSK